MTHNGLQIDFRVVEPDQFGNVLQHLTGSKQHNMELREYAVRRGLHVSEYGIEEDETGDSPPLPDRGAGVRGARPALHRAGAARGPRRAAGRDRRRRCRSWSPRRTCKGDLHCPHDAVGRAQHARGHGEGGAEARLRVPRRHRPLRLARVRQRRAGRRAAAAGRARARAERGAGRLHACWPAPR